MKKKNKTENKTEDYQRVISGLYDAWEELRTHPHKDTFGQDGLSIRSFSAGYSSRIMELSEKLSKNKFHFLPLKRATVSKGREILIQSVEERIVSLSMLKVITPYLEDLNSNHDFSRRLKYDLDGNPPKFNGIPLAVKNIQKYFDDGYLWILETDIKGFFDNVPKKKVFDLISLNINDKKILRLIKEIIYFKISKKSKGDKNYNPKKGIAQGSPLSPLLASIYLYEFDIFIVKNYPDVKLIRYVDDFIILCKDKETTEKMYNIVLKKLKSMGLDIYKFKELNKNGLEKTKFTCVKGYGSHSFDFLGLSFNHKDVDITNKKKDEMMLKIKEIIHAQGNFLDKVKIIKSRLNGYIEHYKWDHYSRTTSSLLKIIKFSEKELRDYYIDTYKKITKQNPFKDLSSSTINSLFEFIGINFNDILKFLFNKN